ncbi:hypothetical protein [Sphingomonas sp. Leaf231]|uniref:hypothetical protein n=1 Tax=Sphingomonas sp. Leaf231 TaxID=1736301 RepID=UPI000A50967F|nr:hypothetical protein [Sphingomonas sp. Leaf231]
MSNTEITLLLYARPDRAMTIEERHARFVERMCRIGSPLGYAGLEPPPAPDCGDGLSAGFSMKYPIRGLLSFGRYKFRGVDYKWEDKASYDEHLDFRFFLPSKKLHYSDILKNQLPLIVDAFEAYRCGVGYDYHSVYYSGGLNRTNPAYNALLSEEGIDVNGRNNIYTLNPAQFWDGELCQRALGFDRDEVIRRLKDVAVLARPVMDGVYLVLNDDPQLTYEAFVEMNERIKPMLGLYYGPSTADAAAEGRGS